MINKNRYPYIGDIVYANLREDRKSPFNKEDLIKCKVDSISSASGETDVLYRIYRFDEYGYVTCPPHTSCDIFSIRDFGKYIFTEEEYNNMGKTKAEIYTEDLLCHRKAKKAMSQCLADEGINRETIRALARETLEEKAESVIKQYMSDSGYVESIIYNKIMDGLKEIVDSIFNKVKKEFREKR